MLAVGVGAFLAERAGLFDNAGWRDALPGVGPSQTPVPAERAGDPVPPPEARPQQRQTEGPDPTPTPQPPGPDGKPDASQSAGRTDQPPGRAARADGKTAPGAAAPAKTDGEPDDDSGAAPRERAMADTQKPDAGSPADPTRGPAAPADDATAPDDPTPDDLTGNDPTGDDPAAPPERGAASDSGGQDPRPSSATPSSQSARGEAGGGEGVRDPDTGMQVTVPTNDEGDDAPPEAQVAERPEPTIPSFDVVRVDRNGEAVIAGRAAPRSRVTVLQGDSPRSFA